MLRPKHLCRHQQAEKPMAATQYLHSRNIDDDIVRRKIVQNITLRLVAEGQIPGQRHRHTSDHTNRSRVVRDSRETIHRRRLQRAVDQKAVVVADECKRDDADCLEHLAIDEDAPANLASQLGRLNRALCHHSAYDDKHRYERQRASFCKLCSIVSLQSPSNGSLVHTIAMSL